MKILYKIGVSLLLFALSGSMQQTGYCQQKNPENININTRQKTLTIYPMPVNRVAHIRLSPALREEVNKIEIINIIGRKMSEQVLLEKSTTDVSFTNLDQLPQGIYMVVARDKFGKIVQSSKMIINR